MASSVGYTVEEAEVKTRSTRSPDETALDVDAIEERPLPELQSSLWWLQVDVSLQSSPVLQNWPAISERPACSATSRKIDVNVRLSSDCPNARSPAESQELGGGRRDEREQVLDFFSQNSQKKWAYREEKSSSVSLKIQGTFLGPTVGFKPSSRRLIPFLRHSCTDASRFGSTYLSKLGFDHTDKNATLGISGVGLTQHLKVRHISLHACGLPCLCCTGASQTRHVRYRSATHNGP